MRMHDETSNWFDTGKTTVSTVWYSRDIYKHIIYIDSKSVTTFIIVTEHFHKHPSFRHSDSIFGNMRQKDAKQLTNVNKATYFSQSNRTSKILSFIKLVRSIYLEIWCSLSILSRCASRILSTWGDA